ncbi:MAG: pentapeptide repeat-containing protein [Acaryochloridaceae cyanobacterium RL_2_7]|nr:pentapeptide repeat-containing protein [Acaryochloridaceae cyanobacterium RL_2_7]
MAMAELSTQEVLSHLHAGLSLQRAELSTIDLQGESLDHGNFEDAYLRKAKLVEASCQETNFSRATFVLAHMRGIVLQDALLNQATLTQADLRDANLIRIQAKDAIFLWHGNGWVGGILRDI